MPVFEKIDAWSVFGSFISMVVSYVAIMVTFFRKELKEMRAEIAQKITQRECEKLRDECQKTCKYSREQRDKYIEKIYEDAVESCDDVRKEVERKAHTHASLGSAGEVIK